VIDEGDKIMQWWLLGILTIILVVGFIALRPPIGA